MAHEANGATPFGSLTDELQAAALEDHAAEPSPHPTEQEVMAAQLVAQQAPSPTRHKRKRKGGRQKDPIWEEVSIEASGAVVCNRCHMVVHRYGCTKVERVRAHFKNKCLFADEVKFSLEARMKGKDVPGEPKTPNRTEYATKMGIFKRRIAQWIFSSGHSFNEVKNGFFRSAFTVLRPGITLPTQYELETDLLELEFNASVAKVSRSLSGKACCLVLENWVNSNGQPMINYIAFCENNSYFLEASPAQSVDNNEFLVDEIERVLNKQKRTIVYGVLTPLASVVNKSSRELIQKKFPQCVFYYGCIANALNLLMTDMCKILPWLETIHDLVVLMIKTFQQNAKLRNQLRSLQYTQGKPPLILPEEAGASICDTLDSVLKSERELVELASRRDFIDSGKTTEEKGILKRIQDFVLGDTFLQDLLNALNILHPLQQQLSQLQNERVPISYVYRCFLDLLSFYAQMELVNKKDKALIASCVNDRFNSIYGDCHGVAYVLDPVFLGADMDEAKVREIEEYIVSFCSQILHAIGIDILDQLAKYRAMVQQLKECNQPYWDLLVSGKVRPFDFWVERRQFPQLQQLAWVVFALPVANMVPDQRFAPATADLHSKFHSQLPSYKLDKLTHIHCNAKYLDPEAKEPEPSSSMVVLPDLDDPNNALV
ncbi:hypothetical protein Poli38472_013833 [Pythium oligandrum]|uniref:DUF659 domain-containing protein n=1 Tax=Pythium oligandrum TaxID=41045 RepID=A0A8K1C262_PYTOL|nr:hypothetical protein Poli38472_013833 [Pythium oligandrum]|eukprot:TMW55071.1 hypothetical protein Poli38472_013833 [Pythium oligandrum]